MTGNGAANGTPEGPPKSGARQGRLAASSPAGRKGDDQGSHSPRRGPQSPDGGRTARDQGREGRGSRGQGGRHGRGRSGSPFVWQPPPGMEDGPGRGRGRGRGRSRGRGAWQDGSQGTHLWGGAGTSCRELAESPRVACQILGNDTSARLLSWSSCPATRTAAAEVRDTLCSGPSTHPKKSAQIK